MSRLPVVGSDDDVWGSILNDYLSVSLNGDGSLQETAVAQTGAYFKPTSGIPLTDLAASTQSLINSVTSKYTFPAEGIPTSDLSSAAQADLTLASTSVQSINQLTPSGAGEISIGVADLDDVTGISSASNNQVLSYDSTTKKWSPANVSVSSTNATSSTPGLIQLDGDLGNTATTPEVVSTHLASALPINQGGTGSITQNFVDLSSTQTIAGNKTLTANTTTNSLSTTSLQVTGGTPGSGKVLTSDASGNATWQALSSDIDTLASDSDVDIASPSNNQVLTYDSISSKWVNQTPSSGIALDTTASDIQSDTTSGSAIAGSIGKAADAGHQHPLVSHDHSSTNKGGNIPEASVTNLVNDLNATEKTANKGIASGYASLNSASLIPTAELGTGTASSTTYLRGDNTWATPNSGSSALANDTDVSISSPSNGELLTYDYTSSKWKNASVPLPPDATTLAPGMVQLSGDLGGTASSPSVPGLSSKANNGANSDITSLSGLTTALSINQGGTGTSTQQAAINSLTNSANATEGEILTVDNSGNAVFSSGSSGPGGSGVTFPSFNYTTANIPQGTVYTNDIAYPNLTGPIIVRQVRFEPSNNETTYDVKILRQSDYSSGGLNANLAFYVNGCQGVFMREFLWDYEDEDNTEMLHIWINNSGEYDSTIQIFINDRVVQ